MVRDRLIDHGVPRKNAKRVRQHLGNRPIHEWSGWFQDILFIEAVERGGALKHWGNGDKCDRLAP